jgi:hypothetical protein
MDQETFDQYASSTWRPVLWVDGELRWIGDGGVLGEPVPKDVTYRFLRGGKYTMLEPKKEPDEDEVEL